MHVVGAVLWREVVKELAEDLCYLRGGSGVGLAEQGLELGEVLFDRVDVWAVARREEVVGAAFCVGGVLGGFRELSFGLPGAVVMVLSDINRLCFYLTPRD
jgi:hypothetical protein